MSVARAGLVGFSCATGLGILTGEFYRNLPGTRWLVVPHPQLGTDDRAFDAACRLWPGSSGDSGYLEQWLSGLDAVVSIEREFVDGLWASARASGVTTVLIPAAEWLDPASATLRFVDRFIAPTRACREVLVRAGYGDRALYLPCPIDTTRFAFRVRERANVFVHFRGWGGHEGRKGTDLVVAAARRCPDIPFIICGQRAVDEVLPDNVQVYGPFDDPEEQYTMGDVAIQPSRWEGIGLQVLEAMACGLPAIVPDAPPLNEYPNGAGLRVRARPRPIVLAQCWTAWETDVDGLVAAIRRLHGRPIAALSRDARRRVELRSWSRLRRRYNRALTARS